MHIFNTKNNMKRKIFYGALLCCLVMLSISGCADQAQVPTTLVAIRPAMGTVGTEVKLYGEGFSPVPSENIIEIYGERAEVTEVDPNEYIKFIAPENPLGSYPVMLTINGKTWTGSKFTYRDLNSKIKVSTLTGGNGWGTAVGDKFTTKFSNVHGISWLEEGKSLAVVSRGSYNVMSVDMEGNSAFLVGNGNSSPLKDKHPWRVTNHDGLLYIPCKASGEVWTYDIKSGETKLLYKGGKNVQDVRFDKAGNMYILQRENGIYRAAAGDYGSVKPWVDFKEEDVAQIHAMYFDPDDNLIVSSNERGLFFMVTPSKQITCIAGSEKGDSDGVSGNPRSAKFNQLYGFVIDSEGTIYTVDGNDSNIGGAQKIKRITKGKKGYVDGTVMTIVGKTGGSIVDGSVDEAVFGNPYDILLDEANRRLFVSDLQNSAIRVVEY